MKLRHGTVDDYIKAAPKAAQPKLRELRSVLKKVAPKAQEALKWGYPVFEEERILFAYSAFPSYISFMPTRSTIDPFRPHLAKYSTGKDTVQFPLDRPLPKTLIKKMAAYRAGQVRDEGVRWMLTKRKKH